MTPTRLRECLAALRWSQRELAACLSCDERRVRRWAAGTYEIPPRVALWLARLAHCHKANPPPDWRASS